MCYNWRANGRTFERRLQCRLQRRDTMYYDAASDAATDMPKGAPWRILVRSNVRLATAQ